MPFPLGHYRMTLPYLQNLLQYGEKLKDSRVSISWSHRESVEIVDESVIDKKYMKIIETPMKTEIMADLKIVAAALKNKRTGTYRNELTMRDEYIAVVDGKATVIGWCNREWPKEQRAEWERKVWTAFLTGSTHAAHKR
jgi:hypothetical protein